MIKKECELTFCDPICLSDSFSCKVTFPANNMKLESLDKRYAESICARGIAEICENKMGCCTGVDARSQVDTWINNNALKYYYDPISFPTPSCFLGEILSKEDQDDVCKKCKDNVKVDLTAANICHEKYYYDEEAVPIYEDNTPNPLVGRRRHHKKCTPYQ